MGCVRSDTFVRYVHSVGRLVACVCNLSGRNVLSKYERPVLSDQPLVNLNNSVFPARVSSTGREEATLNPVIRIWIAALLYIPNHERRDPQIVSGSLRPFHRAWVSRGLLGTGLLILAGLNRSTSFVSIRRRRFGLVRPGVLLISWGPCAVRVGRIAGVVGRVSRRDGASSSGGKVPYRVRSAGRTCRKHSRQSTPVAWSGDELAVDDRGSPSCRIAAGRRIRLVCKGELATRQLQ